MQGSTLARATLSQRDSKTTSDNVEELVEQMLSFMLLTCCSLQLADLQITDMAE